MISELKLHKAIRPSLGYKFLKIVTICVLFLASYASWATTEREREITKALLAEGIFTVQQSTVDGLLRILETSDSEQDLSMAYHNLERFHPYSEETSLKILKLVYIEALKESTDLNMTRLLLAFGDSKVYPTSVLSYLRDIMLVLPVSEAKMLTAVSLAKLSSEKNEAIEVLYSLLKKFDRKSHLKVLAAFQLLRLNEHNRIAEKELIKILRSGEGAAVFLQGESNFLDQVSEKLIEEMQMALNHFSGERLKIASDRLQRIINKKFSRENTCTWSLEGEKQKAQIIPFK